MSVIPSVIDCLFYLKKNRTYTTVEFKVWGYSSKCKARIENELKVDGIKKAKWNGDTKMLTAIFDPKIVSLEQIQACFCRILY